MPPSRIASRVLLPAAIPEIFTGIRIGFSLTLIGTLLGEMFASQRGLGYLLIQAIGLHNVARDHGADVAARGDRRDGERAAARGRPAAATAYAWGELGGEGNHAKLVRNGAGAAVCAALLFACAAHAAEPDFVPSAELLAAAKKEGKIVLYTANFLDTEQAVVKRFSERFPGIQIEIVRAPTGQLITRIKTEAAANRMIADVIDISDRVQARGHGRAVRALCAAERRRLSAKWRARPTGCGRAPATPGPSPTTPSS